MELEGKLVGRPQSTGSAMPGSTTCQLVSLLMSLFPHQ